MPLNLRSISNYHSRKFVVKNITNGPLTIGDLRITLNPNSAQDLLSLDSLTKKPLKSFDKIANSRDLELLIVLGKIKIFNEEGEITSQSESLDFAELGSKVEADSTEELNNNFYRRYSLLIG